MLNDTKKYDGSLHYRFRTLEITRTPHAIALYRAPFVEMDSYRGTICVGSHLLEVMYNDRHHNVLFLWETNWIPRILYINIATPAFWDDKCMSAIDLDLDLIKKPGNHEIILDDEDEFELHREKFGYPEELVRTCKKEVETVTGLINNENGIFSPDVFSWRPGDPLPFEL